MHACGMPHEEASEVIFGQCHTIHTHIKHAQKTDDSWRKWRMVAVGVPSFEVLNHAFPEFFRSSICQNAHLSSWLVQTLQEQADQLQCSLPPSMSCHTAQLQFHLTFSLFRSSVRCLRGARLSTGHATRGALAIDLAVYKGQAPPP